MIGYLEWEVEKIIKSQIISYDQRIRGRTKSFEELPYFVKWREYSEDTNTWEPPEHLEHGEGIGRRF